MNDEVKRGNRIQNAEAEIQNAEVEMMRTPIRYFDACIPGSAFRIANPGSRLSLHRSSFRVHR
jgi:hypothetical protein